MASRRAIVMATAFAGAAALSKAGAQDQFTATDHDMTPEEIRIALKLEPHPTCGYVRITYLSKTPIAPGGLPAPFEAGRPLGSALYFMVTPERSVRLHRIRNDQLYHYYLGDPLDVIMLRGDGTSERAVLGPDLRAGQVLQLFIPGNTFHTARLLGRGNYFAGASTEWPGVEPRDVETGDLEALAQQYPAVAAELREFAKTASR